MFSRFRRAAPAAPAAPPPVQITSPIVEHAGKEFVVTVSVQQARNLMAADKGVFRGTSDPYAIIRVVTLDGKTTDSQQTEFCRKTLAPVWNRRFEFNTGAVPPVSVYVEVFDHDKASAHDFLGHCSIPLSTADLLVGATVARPVHWVKLEGPNVKSGEVLLQVAVQEVDPARPLDALRIANAKRAGLITLRLGSITGFKPGPRAVKALGSKVFECGEYDIRIALQFGLRQFRSGLSPGPWIHDASKESKEAKGKEPVPPSRGYDVDCPQNCKIWLRHGEEGYVTQITAYAIARKADSKGHYTTVPLGRGFARTDALGDFRRHGFDVYLREESEKDMELTDAEQNVLLGASSPAAPLGGSRPGSASARSISLSALAGVGIGSRPGSASTSPSASASASASSASPAAASAASSAPAPAGLLSISARSATASPAPLSGRPPSPAAFAPAASATGGAAGVGIALRSSTGGGAGAGSAGPVSAAPAPAPAPAPAGGCLAVRAPRSPAASGVSVLSPGVDAAAAGAAVPDYVDDGSGFRSPVVGKLKHTVSSHTHAGAGLGTSSARIDGHISPAAAAAGGAGAAPLPVPVHGHLTHSVSATDAHSAGLLEGGPSPSADDDDSDDSGPWFRPVDEDAVHETGLEPELKGTVVGCLHLQGELQSRDELEHFFFSRLLAKFDSDGSGSLDRGELALMLDSLGAGISSAEFEALVGKLDTSGDGKLDAAELLAWFRSPEFHAQPFAYSLLAFLADGKAGMDALIHDVRRTVDKTDVKTSAGAHVVKLTDGEREMLAPEGLRVFHRHTGIVLTEHVPAFVLSALRFMYENRMGSAFANSAAGRAALRKLSAAEGATMDKPSSASKIPAFIREHKINMAECKIDDPSGYRTFNDFFARELKPGARAIADPWDDSVAVSPADCRMVCYTTLAEAAEVWVKGRAFTVETLLGPEGRDVAPLFAGGSIVVARLAPQDYHRWHMPVTGRIVRQYAIDGALYTVNPIAIRRGNPDVYTANKRVVYLVETRHFGLVVMVAVGATVVGSINNVITPGSFALKGECHGFFKFGGSTVLVLFQPGALALDADLRAYALQPLETYVRVGEHIGKAAALQPASPGRSPSAAAATAAEGPAGGAGAVATPPAAARSGTLRADDPDYAAYLQRAADETAALLAAAAASAAAAAEDGSGVGVGVPARRASAVASALAASAAAAATAAAGVAGAEPAVSP